jgi:hypothetical protein
MNEGISFTRIALLVKYLITDRLQYLPAVRNMASGNFERWLIKLPFRYKNVRFNFVSGLALLYLQRITNTVPFAATCFPFPSITFTT